MENTNMRLCQSCAMPMGDTDELYGTNADGSKNEDYCKYCFDGGKLLGDSTMEEMIDICVPHMVSESMNEEQARAILNETLPKLKRWASA